MFTPLFKRQVTQHCLATNNLNEKYEIIEYASFDTCAISVLTSKCI